jgi:hypothetical protein
VVSTQSTTRYHDIIFFFFFFFYIYKSFKGGLKFGMHNRRGELTNYPTQKPLHIHLIA